MIFDGSTVLITGGTGSFGKNFVSSLLKLTVAQKIIIFSRDELKQHEMRALYKNDARLRFFLGDIRDLNRLNHAMHGVDFVVHAAALKQVDTGEYNPTEFVKTNILGTQNVIDASIEAKVKKVIALSTDKASSPINLYGATKLTADKLVISANNFGQKVGTKFSVVRYGNVFGSRGSVVPYFKSRIAENLPIPITDKRMTRFIISLDQAIDFVFESFDLMTGGELFVPKIPSINIMELVAALSSNYEIQEIGIRPGEKLHEEMISEEDSRRTLLCGNRFVVTPVAPDWGFSHPKGIRVPENFAYKSNTNDSWMNREQIIEFLEKI